MAEATPAIRSGFMLPDYVREIRTVHHGLRALRLQISALRPENRDDDVLRVMEETLRPLAYGGVARIFRLPNGDYLLCFHTDRCDEVRSVLIRLRLLVSDDPLSNHFGDAEGEDSALMTWWALERDFESLQALAEAFESTAIQRAEALAQRDGSRSGMAKGDATRAAAEADERAAAGRLGPLPEGRRRDGQTGDGESAENESPQWRPIVTAPRTAGQSPRSGHSNAGRRPIDPDTLDRLENGLARADLSNHVRRQPICALVGTAPPQPLFEEVHVSISELRDTIAPRVDMTANRWLFQHLTETLDRRVLSWLNREGMRLLKGGFSININVSSILSDDFLRFEQTLAAGLHGTVVLELRVEDIFSDLESYAFAADFVHQRGYRVCLDFLTPQTMALLDRTRLGADMMKLFWSTDLPAAMDTPAGRLLAARLKSAEGPRTILARCDDPAAITLGRELGISMFQGRHIDGLLAASNAPAIWTRA